MASSMKRLLVLTFFFIVGARAFAQYPLSYGQSNLAGVQGVIYNPANLADNRLKIDIQLATVYAHVDNSFINFSTPYPQIQVLNGKLDTFYYDENDIPEFESYYLEERLNGNQKTFSANVEVGGPSFMMNLKDRSGFAFFTRSRFAAHLAGLDESLLKIFMEDQDTRTPAYKPKQHQIRHLDQEYEQGPMSIGAMAFQEFGLSYARVLDDHRENFWKAGASFKYLVGFGGVNARFDNINYQLTGIDSAQFTSVNGSYSYIKEDFFNQSGFGVGNFFGKDRLGRGVALDLGLVYEYRPNFRNTYYMMDRKRHEDPTISKYKFRVGAALVDIGQINYKSYARQVNVGSDSTTLWNNFDSYKSPGDLPELDSFAFAHFAGVDTSNDFTMKLPASLNLDFDLQLSSNWYLGFRYMQSLRGKKVQGVRKPNRALTNIRYESEFFEFGTSFQFGKMRSPVQMGMYTRVGPVFIGSDNLGSLINTKSSNGINLYAGVRWGIHPRKISDSDNDGTSDEKDKCPELAGSEYAWGCPDRDDDRVADRDDKCPDIKGDKRLKGCPDPDGDGVVGKDDFCPDEFGGRGQGGCPDIDMDGVGSHIDDCPDDPGPISNNGCPEGITVVEQEIETVASEPEEIVEIEVVKDTPKPEAEVFEEVVEPVEIKKPEPTIDPRPAPITSEFNFDYNTFDYYVVLGVYKNKNLADALSKKLYTQAKVLTYIFEDGSNGLNYVTFGRADSDQIARKFKKMLDKPEVNRLINGHVWWKKIAK